jgi:hypothetical protein
VFVEGLQVLIVKSEVLQSSGICWHKVWEKGAPLAQGWDCPGWAFRLPLSAGKALADLASASRKVENPA